MAFDAGIIKAKMTVDKSQWDKSAKKINTDQKKMATQSKKTGMAMKGMWKQVAIGIGVTHLVTAGIRGMMRQMSDTIKTGREFEREWANVTTMLDTSRSMTQKMRHELKMLSPTLGDTTDLAKGMYQVLSASIKPAKAIKFLGEAAKAAKAGVTDTKTAVDALTTVINAYGMEAEEVTDVSDIMFATVKRGKLTYGELAHSLGTVVPVAATVGVEFKEIAAATATLTRQGIQASKATMQLRQVMMAALKPSEQALQTAKMLGLEFGAQALKAKGLSGFLFDLKEKTGGSADLMAKLVPNVRALTAVMALAGEQAGELAYDVEFMDKALGMADVAFRKQMESVDFWAETFSVAMDKIKIAIYDGLTSQLREAIKTSDDFDEKVTQVVTDAANAISLHVSTMVESLTWLIETVNSLNVVHKEEEEEIGILKKAYLALTGQYGELAIVTNVAKDPIFELIKAEKELKEALPTKDIENQTTAIEDASAAVSNFQELMVRWEAIELFKPEIITNAKEFSAALKEQQKVLDPLGLKTLELAEDTDLLEYHWAQDMGSMKEETLAFLGEIVPGVSFMSKAVAADVEGMGTDVKMSLETVAMQAGNILLGLGQHSKALAYAGAIINTAMAVTQALRHFPPPISFAMAAVQAAAGAAQIKVISKQDIPSAAEGGWIPKPAVIEAGHGPMGEVIRPIGEAPGMAGGAKVDLNFYAPIISTTGIAESDIDRAAEYLLKKVDKQFSRYGGKLNG